MNNNLINSTTMLSFFTQNIDELRQMVGSLQHESVLTCASVPMPSLYPPLGCPSSSHPALIKPSQLTPLSSADSTTMSSFTMLPLFANHGAPLLAPPPPPALPPDTQEPILLPSRPKPRGPGFPMQHHQQQELHNVQEGRKTKRQCCDCGYVKALGEFYPLTMEDGTAHLSTRCIDCIRTHAQAWFDEQAHTGNTKACVYCRLDKPFRDFNLLVNFDIYCTAMLSGGDFACGLEQLCRACSILAQSGRSRKRAADKSFMVVAEKCCTRCTDFKPAEVFPRDKYMADGLYIYCKPCTSEMKKIQREKRQHRMVAQPVPNTKICRRCNESKRLTEFRRSPSTNDGHAGTCKTCQTAEERERRAVSVSGAPASSAGASSSVLEGRSMHAVSSVNTTGGVAGLEAEAALLLGLSA